LGNGKITPGLYIDRKETGKGKYINLKFPELTLNTKQNQSDKYRGSRGADEYTRLLSFNLCGAGQACPFEIVEISNNDSEEGGACTK
jgi:hypothetical protein